MSDKARFSQLMDDLALLYDKDVSVGLKRLYWDDLGHLPINVIEMAMQAHRRDPERGRFFPKPADLIDKLQILCPDGRPDADEAWAQALAVFDETASVCTTDEILEAVASASPVWELGDKIGARMAFKSAYERIVADRRMRGAQPTWQLSLGWDRANREHVAQEALRLGRLPLEAVQDYLPAPEPQGPAAAIAGLLTGKNVVEFPTDAKTRAHLARLRDMLKLKRGAEPDRDPAAAREAFKRKRQEALEAIERMRAERNA